MLSGLYASAARVRRAWYRPHRQQHLDQPVVSVGNLVVGGSGKTPTVAFVAQVLQALGERPAILSRGYGRRSTDEVVVVSSGEGPRVEVYASGDEPQMLAAWLQGVPVVVSADRYQAGRVAEREFGVTVHLLDDGFQHLTLARDVDLVMLAGSDLDERVLPFGRLREPITTARAANALLVSGDATVQARAQALAPQARVFAVEPICLDLQFVLPGAGALTERPRTVVAVAGIARPTRFFDSLRAQGLEIAKAIAYPDHHWFDATDCRSVENEARRLGATAIVTTEKDAVRLWPELPSGDSPDRALDAPVWLYQPYAVRLTPEDEFRTWLGARVASARARRGPRPA